MAQEDINRFRQIVWRHYRTHGRHNLPWRRTKSLYRVLVSEVMLQQTQVERVLPFYKRFLKQFPTAKKLAEAPLAEVLEAWQGLGYNRRAKLLWQAAHQIAEKKPSTIAELEALPGVGPYTARAVAAFARNEEVVFVETNIRTAVLQHFFPRRKKVSDREIETVLARALPKGRARQWQSALMDYGASLKKSGVQLNKKSTSYRAQLKFAGSHREARGAIVKMLVRGSATRRTLTRLLGEERRTQLAHALQALIDEGMVVRRGSRYRLA